MDTGKLLEVLSLKELVELQNAVPVEFERRGEVAPFVGTVALAEILDTSIEAPTPESLLGSFDTAYQTYNFLVDTVNKQRAGVKGRKKDKPAQFESVDQDIVKADVEALLTPGLLEELNAEITYHSKHHQTHRLKAGFDLVIVPEGLTPADEEAIAHALHAKLYPTWGGSGGRSDEYNDNRPPVVTGKGYRIVFAPRHYNVPRGTAGQQRTWMKAHNQDTTAVTELQTATDAEALAFINNLQANGELNDDHDLVCKTEFRRFDQAPHDGYVSDVYLCAYGPDGEGGLCLHESRVNDANHPARALVVPKA